MAAKGRSKTTLTQEQLQALGCVGKDMPAVAATPAPTYPTLHSKPVPLEVSSSVDYQILWKEDFSNYMKESPYYLEPKISTQTIQRFSDQYANILQNTKEKQKSDIPWILMPNELKPNSRRKRKQAPIGKSKTSKKKKSINPVNLEEHLKKLEEKETTDPKDIDSKGKKNAEESEDEDMNEEENPDDIEDDEMDEDNDYGNNYFDNGEAFNEEDDNLDDGPIY